jgi:dienelactone hydrolase
VGHRRFKVGVSRSMERKALHAQPDSSGRSPRKRSLGRWLKRLGLLILAFVLVALLFRAVWSAWISVRNNRRAEPQLSRLRAMAQGNDVRDVTARGLEDGGVRLGGKLEGREFALMFPKTWNGEVILFIHGYTFPDSPIKVPEGLHGIEFSESLQGLFGQGYAIGFAAYDKAGFAVQSGAENTLRLRHYVARFHPKRVFAMGMSMGGTITLALLETFPGSFDGALVGCGVVDGWQDEVRYLIDIRAAYEYFTRNTPYALPGDARIDHSLLPTKARGIWALLPTVYQFNEVRKIMNPVVALFKAAAQNPGGPEDHIVRNIASTAQVDPEVSTFLFSITLIGLGMDDLNTTMSGIPYENVNKVYHSQYLSEPENAQMNRGIQRIASSAGAMKYSQTWHQARGNFQAPLVTFHNRVDPLVPYSQETALAAAVTRQDNLQHLLQLTVPEVSTPLFTTGLKGLAHCGFKKEDTLRAFGELRTWVETETKPSPPGK